MCTPPTGVKVKTHITQKQKMWSSYKLRQSKEQKKLNQTAKFYRFPLTMARKNEPSNSQGKFFQEKKKERRRSKTGSWHQIEGFAATAATPISAFLFFGCHQIELFCSAKPFLNWYWCSDGSRETLYVSQVVRCSVRPGAGDAFFVSKFSQNWLKPVR